MVLEDIWISGGSLPGKRTAGATARRRARLEWGEQGVAEEVDEVRKLTGGSTQPGWVQPRVCLPVHSHHAYTPGFVRGCVTAHGQGRIFRPGHRDVPSGLAHLRASRR